MTNKKAIVTSASCALTEPHKGTSAANGAKATVPKHLQSVVCHMRWPSRGDPSLRMEYQEWHHSRTWSTPHTLKRVHWTSLDHLHLWLQRQALPSIHPGLELSSDKQGSSCLPGKAPLEGVTFSVGGWKSEVMRCNHQQIHSVVWGSADLNVLNWVSDGLRSKLG